MSESTAPAPGRQTSEYQLARMGVWAGVAMIVAGLGFIAFGSIPEPRMAMVADLVRWIILGGVGLVVGSAAPYGLGRAWLKKALSAVVMACLVMLPALAMAGLLDPPQAQAAEPVVSTPKAASTNQAADLAAQVAALQAQIEELKAARQGDDALTQAALTGVKTQAALMLQGVDVQSLKMAQLIAAQRGAAVAGAPYAYANGNNCGCNQTAVGASASEGTDTEDMVMNGLTLFGVLKVLIMAGILVL